MTPRTRVKRWGALAAEACGSLLLVLVLYWLFMLFLYGMFPSGTPLRELMQSTLEPGSGTANLERRPDATLSTLMRDVRFRRGNSIAWAGATEGMQLYSQDAVQTFDRSGARISFDAKEQLLIGSNSLIVVTKLDGDEEAGPKSYRVKVDGELHGKFSAARKLRMEFEAGGHLAWIGPGRANFRVARNGRNSASLAVFSGEAQVLDRGRMIRVPANYGVTMQKGGGVTGPLPIPGAPELRAGDQVRLTYRLLPPKVRLAWSGAVAEYHLQVSRDPHFRSCDIDRRLQAQELVTGILEGGSYFWRVSAVNQGVEGPFSRVGRCQLRQLLDSPALRVNFPAQNSAPGSCVLTGTAPAGSTVYVDGGEVALDESGAFSCELRLKPGVNLIRVEALDAAGNASYASRIVYGKGREGSAAPAAAVIR